MSDDDDDDAFDSIGTLSSDEVADIHKVPLQLTCASCVHESMYQRVPAIPSDSL